MAQSSLSSSNNQNYLFFSRENMGGLAGTVQSNATGGAYSLSSLLKNRSPSQASSLANSGTAATSESYYPSSAIYKAQNHEGPAGKTRLWDDSNRRDGRDGRDGDVGTPWVRDATALGGLGLGIASFFEQRKTAKLQRDALRHDIATAKEQRVNRQAMADSWNRAWSK